MILENSRARLLPFSQRSASTLEEIIFEPEIWTFMGHYIKTNDDLKTYISQTIQAYEHKQAIPFVVIDKDYGSVAGCSRLGKLDFSNGRAEIGWTWYAPKFQGTGLNMAVKALLLQYGFEGLHFNRIQLGADIRNLRSQKAIEKLGATKEGIRRSHYVDSEGGIQDDVYYSITKEDWKNHIKSRLKI